MVESGVVHPEIGWDGMGWDYRSYKQVMGKRKKHYTSTINILLKQNKMDFNSWLNQIKIDEPDLESFIIKLEPFFSEIGFRGNVFERKVTIGLSKIDTEINELLKPEQDVEN